MSKTLPKVSISSSKRHSSNSSSKSKKIESVNVKSSSKSSTKDRTSSIGKETSKVREKVPNGENPLKDFIGESEFAKNKRKSSLFKTITTERIPIEFLLGDSYKPYGHAKKKKGKDTLSKSKMESNGPQILEVDGQRTGESNVWTGTKSKVINFSVIRELKVRPNKYTEHLIDRNIKMTKNMERPFLIIHDNVDYTPNRAVKPEDRRWLTNPLLFTFPSEKLTAFKPEDLLKNFGSSSTKATLDFGKKSSQAKPTSDYKIATTIESGDEDENLLSSVAPSMYHLVYPEPPPIDKKCVSFKLCETDIIILLDVKSRASEIGDEEALAIEKDNQYQVILKKRLRKTVENYSQTSMDESNRTKETQISRRPRANSYGYISNWAYYDTIQEMTRTKTIVKMKQDVGKVESIIYIEEKSTNEPLIESNFKIFDRLNWFRTGMILERLLLSNNAFERQLIFYDLLKSDPLCNTVEFKYELKRLWTLRDKDTKGQTITSMSWNLYERNILAVGYGKYSFSNYNKGLVCLWNNKNLANPERKYRFEHPVTSLQFSKIYPALLAVGFYSGMVMIINISSYSGVKVVAQNILARRTLVYPVWQIAWIKKQEVTVKKMENLIECRSNGCVYKYTRSHLYEKQLIMRVSKTKGLVKGVPCPKKCEAYVLPLVRHPAILCIALHPKDSLIYYVGSDEGAIYKCSLQDVHQHLEMFRAHSGPVYTLQFHPGCEKIFLTCGADGYIRVWADGIFAPLITMISGMSAVQSACWCPCNPTVIASITKTRIELWDISRKINLPQATVENPFGCMNTALIFSQCGNNLCVGDADGNVIVYTLTGMPFTPIFQDMVLAMALLKALIPHPKLVTELQKLGDPFNVNRIYKNLINLPF